MTKSLLLALAVLTAPVLTSPLRAADDAKPAAPAGGKDKSKAAPAASAEPGTAAEAFYAGYIAQVEANKDTKKWVAASKAVTAKFKKAYAKAMGAEQVDADPVLLAQEVPSQPFKAGKAEVKDNTATVVLTAAFGKDKHSVTVTLAKVDGAWLVDGVK